MAVRGAESRDLDVSRPSIFSTNYSRLVKRVAPSRLIPASHRHQWTISDLEARDHVLSAIAVRTGIEPKLVLGRSRVYGVVYARKLASAALRSIGFTFASIGWAFDRDHSSVMHQVSEIYDMSRFDQQAANDLVWAIHAADELAS